MRDHRTIFLSGLMWRFTVVLAVAAAVGSASELNEASDVIDSVCTADASVARCTLDNVIDISDVDVLRRVFSATRAEEPVLIRGGARHWRISKLAADGWSAIKPDLLSWHGDTPMPSLSAVFIAHFGHTSASVQQTSMREHLDMAERGGQHPIAFQSRSDIGKRMVADKLFDFDMGEGGYLQHLKAAPVFSLGGDEVGLPFHHHGESLLGLVTGRKEWLLMPPGEMTEEVLSGSANTSGYFAGLKARGGTGSAEWPQGLHYCDQRAGDVLFLPLNWWHATRNEGMTLGLGGQRHWTKESQAEHIADLRLRGAPGVQLSVPDREILAMGRMQSQDETTEAAEGLADMQEMIEALPSKWSLHYSAAGYLYAQKQRVAGQALLVRTQRQLQVLESRDALGPAELASLHAHFGDLAVNKFRDAPIGLRFMDEALRLDADASAEPWFASALSLLDLGGEDSLRKAERRLERALLLVPGHAQSLQTIAKIKDGSALEAGNKRRAADKRRKAQEEYYKSMKR